MREGPVISVEDHAAGQCAESGDGWHHCYRDGQPGCVGHRDRYRQSGFVGCQSGRRHSRRRSVYPARRADRRRRQHSGGLVNDFGRGDALANRPVHRAGNCCDDSDRDDHSHFRGGSYPECHRGNRAAERPILGFLYGRERYLREGELDRTQRPALWRLYLPSSPGIWVFRYYTGNDNAITATSAPLSLGVSDFSVSAAPGTVAPGAPITVTWTAPPGRSGDSVQLFRLGVSNTSSAGIESVNGASGTFTMNAPPTAGEYQFRYLLGGGWVTAAVGPVIMVE